MVCAVLGPPKSNIFCSLVVHPSCFKLMHRTNSLATDHKTSEEAAEIPSRRANATLTADPVSTNTLWLYGGEYFDGTNCYFYPDLYRYIIDKNEWRRLSSPTQPGPRSAHQVVASSSGGGKLWLFGGEYAALNQTAFHHYRDLWAFDLTQKSWERFDTKMKPSARSGHRMAMWKHYVVLFGGFHDVGIRTTYLSDLWLWDTLEYRWHEVVIRDADRRPSARSGFSFLPCAEGIILHGGYCKEYQGNQVKGVVLDDTWLLRMDTDTSKLKWERRKKQGYPPSPRSGVQMAHWAAKGMGVYFGGVFDTYDSEEDDMVSIFYNELFGYQTAGNGRWVSLMLKRPKKKAGGGVNRAKKKKQLQLQQQLVQARRGQEDGHEERFTDGADKEDGEENRSKGGHDNGDDDEDNEQQYDGSDNDDERRDSWRQGSQGLSANGTERAGTPQPGAAKEAEEVEDDPDDPIKTIPIGRYNAMLAVQRNTLYIYGGIVEAQNREFTLDDFYSLVSRGHTERPLFCDSRQSLSTRALICGSTMTSLSLCLRFQKALDKLDRYVCHKECNIAELEWKESDSEDEGSSSDSESDSGSESDDDSSNDDREAANDATKNHLKQEAGQPDGSDESATFEEATDVAEDAVARAAAAAATASAAEESAAIDLRKQATAFMESAAQAKDRTPEDAMSIPLPGETLKTFYDRTRSYWAQKAHESSDNRGKSLRRDGFQLADDRYASYKPILDEIERIQAEAGLEDDDVVKGGQAKAAGLLGIDSRNRR